MSARNTGSAAWERAQLKEAFSDVPVGLKLIGGPINPGNPSIFQWTPTVDRRYLCGRDDLHLFIAQVREGNTVAEAHESLKPDVVRRAEALSPGGVQRQGEWFFLAPSGEESERLAGHLKERPGAVVLGASLGNGSRPHVADSVVNIDRRTRTKHREYRRPEVYARGAVVHPDHRRLWLEDWRRSSEPGDRRDK